MAENTESHNSASTQAAEFSTGRLWNVIASCAAVKQTAIENHVHSHLLKEMS